MPEQCWLVPHASRKMWSDDCRNAVASESAFRQFRCLPGIRRVTENKPTKHAAALWQYVQDQCPQLCCFYPFLQKIDAIGSPLMADIDLERRLAPTTVGNFADLAALNLCFGSLTGMNIVEIGAGYGSLAAMIAHVHKPASYVIYDIPEAIALQQKFLSAVGAKGVVHCTGMAPIRDQWDLVISDCALSELDPPTRNQYAELLLSRSLRGWIHWNSPPSETPGRITDPVAILAWLWRTRQSHKATVRHGKYVSQYKNPLAARHFFWGDNFTQVPPVTNA